MPERTADTCAALNAPVLMAAPPVENNTADARISHRAPEVVTTGQPRVFALCLPVFEVPAKAVVG